MCGTEGTVGLKAIESLAGVIQNDKMLHIVTRV